MAQGRRVKWVEKGVVIEIVEEANGTKRMKPYTTQELQAIIAQGDVRKTQMQEMLDLASLDKAPVTTEA